MSEHTSGPCPHCGVNASEVMPLVVKLRLQRDELLAALEAVEFSEVESVGGWSWWTCPSCGNNQDMGHDPDCQLAAAIQAARGE